MRDPTYPLFPIFSFLGFFLSLVPFSWHCQAWNAGTCAYMLWVSLACLVEFVNSIVWSDNVNNVAPIWCDISSKFLLGAGVGISASVLCISRRLYSIAAVQNVSISREDKRRAVIGDICIAGGIPVLVMTLHYIVQGHRFNILEEIGCYAATYNTLPAYFLVFLWPVFLGCISFVYSFLTLRAFWRRRVQFSEFLSSNNSMNFSRYLRLMAFAISDMMCTVPLSIYSIYISNLGVGLAPWVSWSVTHANFSHVDLIPSLLWRGDPSFQTAVELTRWLFPASAFIFFALFGFASEAQKHYRLVFWWIAGRFGFKPAPRKATASQAWKQPLKPNSTAVARSVPVSLTGMRKEPPYSFTLSMESSDFDVEKSAGLCSISLSSCPSPPEYFQGNASRHTDLKERPTSATTLTSTSDSCDRFYISDVSPPNSCSTSLSDPVSPHSALSTLQVSDSVSLHT